MPTLAQAILRVCHQCGIREPFSPNSYWPLGWSILQPDGDITVQFRCLPGPMTSAASVTALSTPDVCAATGNVSRLRYERRSGHGALKALGAADAQRGVVEAHIEQVC